MKHFLILLVFLFLLSIPSPRYVESSTNEPTISTPSPGFFGYFGNLWKKSWSNNEMNSTQTSTSTRTSVGHTRIHRTVETPTTESAGLFNHVKNWMGVIREKIPLNMQKKTSQSLKYTSKGAVSVSSNRSSSRSTTEFVTLNADVSKLSAKSADNHDGMFEENIPPSTTNDSSATTTESSNRILDDFPQQSLEKLGEFELSDISFVSAGKDQNTQSDDVQMNLFVSKEKMHPGDTGSSDVSSATTSSEQNTHSEDAEINPFVYLEKINRNVSSSSSKLMMSSSSSNELTESTTAQTDADDSTEGPVTKNKLSNVNKLTPVYFSFYNAEDLVSNGAEREAEPLPTVPSKIYAGRTRKSKNHQ